MEFHFVNNGDITGKHRKLIRSHVMKGKNVGKQRWRSVGDKSLLQSEHEVEAKQQKEMHDRQAVPLPLVRPFTNDLAYFTFPTGMRMPLRESLHRWIQMTGRMVHPLCIHNVSRLEWFTYLQTNEAFFWCILALSEASIDEEQARPARSNQTLLYLSKTYRCINNDLNLHGVPSDETIAAVTALAIYEDLRRENVTAKTHLDALERMVGLRGGLDGLGTNPLLVQKLCRVDIEYAMREWSKPRFYRYKFPSEAVSKADTTDISTVSRIAGFDRVHFSASDNLAIAEVYEDFMTACSMINDGAPEAQPKQGSLRELLISIAYRLLRLCPLGNQSSEEPMTSPYALALLALLSTLYFQLEHLKRESFRTLERELHVAIDESLRNPLYPNATQLWFLFIGGISVCNSEADAWLLPEIRQCLRRLDIDNWHQAREEIKKSPWIDTVHDEAGRSLWKRVLWS